jgi:hypothetical protein
MASPYKISARQPRQAQATDPAAERAARRGALLNAPDPLVAGDFESHMAPMEEPSRGPVTVDLDAEQPSLDQALKHGPVSVDLDTGALQAMGGGEQQGAFGEQPNAYEHYENVALRLEENELAELGRKVWEAVDADITSRKDWESMLAAGTRMLTSGEVEDADHLLEPIKIVKHIKHPMFGIAVYQFQTRAYKQLLPPSGPVKVVVNGQSNDELEQKRTRVEDFQNYQLLREDPSYQEQTDQLLLVEAIDGSTFRKWFRDPLKKRNVGRWARAEDVIVPYGAESMETALRITHRFRQNSADIHRLMLDPASGYRQVALGNPAPSGETTRGRGEQSEITKATDQVQGTTPTGMASLDESDEYTLYEQQVYLDLGEHVDAQGNPTGVPLPYVVTIEVETQSVLCIWRDWDEEDEEQRRVQHFAHYKFLPGPGFYGLGYAHLLVGLAAGTTAALRILLIGALFSSAGGGFVTKEAGGKMPSGIAIEPGLFKAIDLSFEDLNKAFYTPDFKQPAPALVQGIEILLKGGERFSSTVEAMVGRRPDHRAGRHDPRHDRAVGRDVLGHPPAQSPRDGRRAAHGVPAEPSLYARGGLPVRPRRSRQDDFQGGLLRAAGHHAGVRPEHLLLDAADRARPGAGADGDRASRHRQPARRHPAAARGDARAAAR